MTIPTFTPPRNPDIDPRHMKVRLRRRVIHLGDGYTKREIEGINGIERTTVLTWSVLSQSEYDSMVAFFEGVGTGAFYYTIPGGPMMKWTPVEWDYGHRSGTYYSFSVSLEEVYDLDE